MVHLSVSSGIAHGGSEPVSHSCRPVCSAPRQTRLATLGNVFRDAAISTSGINLNIAGDVAITCWRHGCCLGEESFENTYI